MFINKTIVNAGSVLHVFHIEKPGPYYTILAYCPHDLEKHKIRKGTPDHLVGDDITKDHAYLQFEGSIVYKNSYGYLSGDQLYFLTFYFLFTVIHIIFGVYYGLVTVQKR